MPMNRTTATRGLVVTLLGVCLALPAKTLADTGGTPAPDPGGSGPVDPSFVLSASNSVFLGGTLQITGSDPNAADRTVTIQQRDVSGTWEPVASADADSAGSFTTTWQPASAGQYELRAALAGAQASDSVTASATRTITVYKPARASWYGPGFFGKRTACGKRLTRRMVGVANRRLACGTQVAIAYRGRSLVVPVVDRGPYARGIQWDLTAAAAKQLGMTVTSRIGVVPITLPLQPPVP
jgi:rare lipoprotein A